MATTNATGNDATFRIQEATATSPNASLAQGFANTVGGQAVKTPANVMVDALGVDQVGASASGVVMPTGGWGMLGWLSGIYKSITTVSTALGGVLNTRPLDAASDSVTVSAADLPLPIGAAKDGSDGAGIAPPTGGAGIRGWLSGIYKAVSGVLNINVSSYLFTASTVNVTTANLAAGATFNGAIENAYNQPGIQVMASADQPYAVTITQFDDLAGAKSLGSSVFTRNAGVPVNETVQVNGNFVRVSITNTGAAPTTALFLDTSYGPLSPFPTSLTNSGNFKTAITENSAGIATDASVQALNQTLVTLTKHLAINNILMSEMVDQGKSPLNQMLNDATVTSY